MSYWLMMVGGVAFGAMLIWGVYQLTRGRYGVVPGIAVPFLAYLAFSFIVAVLAGAPAPGWALAELWVAYTSGRGLWILGFLIVISMGAMAFGERDSG